MWMQTVVIVLSLMLGISVSYGQEAKAPAKSKLVRFTQGGYQYTVQSALRDGRLETSVRYTTTAGRSSAQPGEVLVVLGRRDASATSRAGDGSTIALTQAGSRLTAVLSYGDKTVRREGTGAQVAGFLSEQDKTDDPARRGRYDLHLGNLVARDQVLRAQLRKSILQTIQELKQRQEARWAGEEWARRCKENPESMGCPKASFCSRANQGCSGGGDISCGAAVLCDWFAALFEGIF